MVRKFVLVAALLPIALASGAASAREVDERLGEAMKAAEQRLQQDPAHKALKEWIEHARDYKMGERSDHPGQPPR